ncbi:MAG: hypothetical protein HY905_26315 [Deltaproteobacteria bacterium]|nr:hypothetical protein [Deltaproteobacteria bacterium]
MHFPLAAAPIALATGWIATTASACGVALPPETAPPGEVSCTSSPGDWPSECSACGPAAPGDVDPIVAPRPSSACVKAILGDRRGAVLSCLPEPPLCEPTSVEVELTADGATGEVRTVALPDEAPPAWASCVVDALMTLRLPPFAEPELRIRYRYEELGSRCQVIGPDGESAGIAAEDLRAMAETFRDAAMRCVPSTGGGIDGGPSRVEIAATFVAGRLTRVNASSGASATCLGNALRELELPVGCPGSVEVQFTFDLARERYLPDVVPFGEGPRRRGAAAG